MINATDIDAAFPLARVLGERFGRYGHELYLVGGVVRDLLLRRQVNDLDFATSALPDETMAILRDGPLDALYPLGAKYGTIAAIIDGQPIEVTTFRSEVYTEDSRKPDVEFATDIKTDLERRDFTINAMAVSLPHGVLIDPFNGVQDLGRGIIDTPLDPRTTFGEDPLRMLRAARFSSTLRFDVTLRVGQSMGVMKDRLSVVSQERIQAELNKLLLGDNTTYALNLLREHGVLEQFLPEVAALDMGTGNRRHKDVWLHTLKVVEGVRPILVLRLAALLHDIGKPVTRKFEGSDVSFTKHEVVGAKMARARLRALRYPTDVIDQVNKLISMHVRWYEPDWSDSAIRRVVRESGDVFEFLVELMRCDNTGTNPKYLNLYRRHQEEFAERLAKLREQESIDAMRPALNGDEVMAFLNITPGRYVGEILHFLMEIRLDEGELSKEEAYSRVREYDKELQA